MRAAYAVESTLVPKLCCESASRRGHRRRESGFLTRGSSRDAPIDGRAPERSLARRSPVAPGSGCCRNTQREAACHTRETRSAVASHRATGVTGHIRIQDPAAQLSRGGRAREPLPSPPDDDAEDGEPTGKSRGAGHPGGGYGIGGGESLYQASAPPGTGTKPHHAREPGAKQALAS